MRTLKLLFRAINWHELCMIVYLVFCLGITLWTLYLLLSANPKLWM